MVKARFKKFKKEEWEGKLHKLETRKVKKLTNKKILRKTKLKNTLLKVGIFVLATFLCIFALVGLYFITYLQDRNKKIPTPDQVFIDPPLATEIYDRNGVLLYRLYNDDSNNDKVDISEISDVVKAA